MGFERVAFAAGIVVGFLAGSRAGREPYNMAVKYGQKAMQSPQARKASAAAKAKARDLSRSAAQNAPKAAGSVARKARQQAGKAPKPWRHSDSTGTPPRVSVNGNGRTSTP